MLLFLPPHSPSLFTLGISLLVSLSLRISFSVSVLRKRHAPLDFRAECPVGKLKKEMHVYFYAYTHALCINKIDKIIRDGAHVEVYFSCSDMHLFSRRIFTYSSA
jgi:hypothetical protein